MPDILFRFTPRGGHNRRGRFASMLVPSPLQHACCLLVFRQAGAVRAQPVQPQAPAPEVMTDTAEYCTRLYERVTVMLRQGHVAAQDEVVVLSSAGHRMCEQGHTRSGILRLRRALVIMQQRGEAP